MFCFLIFFPFFQFFLFFLNFEIKLKEKRKKFLFNFFFTTIKTTEITINFGHDPDKITNIFLLYKKKKNKKIKNNGRNSNSSTNVFYI